MYTSANRLIMLSVILLLLAGSLAVAHEAKPKKEIQKQKMSHHWAAPADERSRSNPVPLSEASVLNGKTLYIQNCVDCHGINADGKGIDAEEMDPKPSNLKAMAGHHSDGDLAWKIKNGRGDMPGWGDTLSEEQIWELVNFIQTLKK